MNNHPEEMEQQDYIGTGKVYINAEKSSAYTYLSSNATRALGLDDGAELDVYEVEHGLLVIPKDENESEDTVHCVHCDYVTRPRHMWGHHVNNHAGEEYDPTWYADSDTGEEARQ